MCSVLELIAYWTVGDLAGSRGSAVALALSSEEMASRSEKLISNEERWISIDFSQDSRDVFSRSFPKNIQERRALPKVKVFCW